MCRSVSIYVHVCVQFIIVGLLSAMESLLHVVFILYMHGITVIDTYDSVLNTILIW